MLVILPEIVRRHIYAKDELTVFSLQILFFRCKRFFCWSPSQVRVAQT